jgi:hypothetical protein
MVKFAIYKFKLVNFHFKVGVSSIRVMDHKDYDEACRLNTNAQVHHKNLVEKVAAKNLTIAHLTTEKHTAQQLFNSCMERGSVQSSVIFENPEI